MAVVCSKLSPGRAEATVDRTAFAMTWSPLKMAAPKALAVVTVRFVRT